MPNKSASIALLSPYDYIQTEITHLGAYHNHKEQMAYAATTLYLAGATALTFAKPPKALAFPTILWILFVGMVVLTEAAGIAFVLWQLRLREKAAKMQRAFETLATRWLNQSPTKDDLKQEFDKGRPIVYCFGEALDKVEKGHAHKGADDPRLPRYITVAVMVMWGLAALVHILGVGLVHGGPVWFR